MKMIRLIVVIAAMIIFGLAALEVSGPRVSLVPLGLFFLALAELLSII